ncbi:hypothetical protein V5F38_04515 [Xanthobacter sp. V0B-10]|uniref:hypothetical protein n=1 Tax=Xanthobacter albus TaxID=3119929 RepID=UPI003729F9B4
MLSGVRQLAVDPGQRGETTSINPAAMSHPVPLHSHRLYHMAIGMVAAAKVA